MVLERFDQLLSMSTDEKPYIYKNAHSASLHFDILSVQSEMDIEEPDRLMLGYTQTMMGFLFFHQHPTSIAMIGLGGGSLPKYCHRHLPDASIVVLEKNENVIALRDHFFIPQNDERLLIQCADGSDFVKTTEEKFDVLIVDGFDSMGQPPQLCSQEFYDNCYQILKDDGIVVANFINDADVVQLYVDRMRRSFDDAVIVIPALDSGNKIAFACKGSGLEASNQSLFKRLEKIAATHTVNLKQVLQSILKQRQAEIVVHRSQEHVI